MGHLTRVSPLLTAAACALLISPPPPAAYAQNEPDAGLLEMVVQLLKDPDRDMRALGLQQVREESPGQAATERFLALLPELPPDARAELVEALGERGDAAARSAVAQLAGGEPSAVRNAALRALGKLGQAEDVPLLAQAAAEGSDAQRSAARQSLVTLRGERVNAALLTALADSGAAARAELLTALAGRDAKQALPAALQCARDSDAGVRDAALYAVRYLAQPQDAAAIVDVLKTAPDPTARWKAELALLAACARGKTACVEPIVAGLAGADAPAQAALLRALGRCGGEDALQAVLSAAMQDTQNQAGDEAVRVLSAWPDTAAVAALEQILQQSPTQRRRVLAIRGLVRLAAPRESQPADLDALAALLETADRPQEKRLALAALSRIPQTRCVSLAAGLLADEVLAPEARLAVLQLAQQLPKPWETPVRVAVEQVLRDAQRAEIRQQAEALLRGP